MSQRTGDDSTGDHPADQTGDGAGELARDRVVVDVLLYAAARLLGVTQFPIVVAALFALIIAMPLGIWLFSPLRRRATAALAIAGERRRREREQLRARLRGEAVQGEPYEK